MARPARRRRQIVRARQRTPSLSGCLPGIRFLSYLSTCVCLLSEDCCQGLQFRIRGFVIILLVSFRNLRFQRETDPCSSCRAFLSDPISANRPHSTHPHRHALYEPSKSWKKKCFWAFSELGPPCSTRCSLGRIVPCTDSLLLLMRELSTRLTLHFSFRFGFFGFSHLGMWALSLALSQVSSSELHWLLLPLIPLVLSFCWSACSSSVLCFFFASVASFKNPPVSSSLCRPSCSCSLEKLYWVEGEFRISRTSSATLIVSQFDGFSRNFKRMIPLRQKSGVLKS